MSFDVNRLYELLPALYRLRDAEEGRALTGSETGGPLRALLSIIAEQVGVLEEDLAQLYDDQFIETSAEWVVPYIGDLIGTRGLVMFPDAQFSQRSQVANTLRYRRRKGTASVIEQLARDVTGWDAAVVEYFERLATTQYMNHLRPENRSMASVRNAAQLERLNTPFDQIPRTADVRRIEPKRGKYNIPNIGVFLWRIQSYPLTDAPAYRVDDRRYTFDALGRDRPLYNKPVTETEITHLAEPTNVPMPLSRRVLKRDLAAHYGPTGSLFLAVDGVAISPENTPAVDTIADLISICDLSNVKDLAGNDVLDVGGQPVGWVNMPQQKIALDPVLGRIAFPALKPAPAEVRVNYRYGFSTNIGGGEYGRSSSFFTETPAPQLIQVSRITPNAIQTAIDLLAATGGIVELTDNGYFLETPTLRIPAGKTIELRAANEKRLVLALNGDFTVWGEAGSEFILNGLLASGGQIRVPEQDSSGADNHLNAIRIRHCTLLPGMSPAITTTAGSVPAQPAMPRLVVAVSGCQISIEDSIVGSLRVSDEASVSLKNSILDAGKPTEIALAGLLSPNPATVFEADKSSGPLTVQNSTIIGKVHTMLMEGASNTIFLAELAPADGWPAPVLADRRQEGCVRFSYVPPGSRVPAPYRCQPQTGADAARVRPVFTSLDYGDAGYGQLNSRCATEIAQGADDGAEMGAFHNLFQPQREANLQIRLDEYLRFGLEAGIFFES